MRLYRLIIVLSFTLPMMYFFSCQEKIYNKKHESSTLNNNPVSDICHNTENIKYARWLGPGTYGLVIFFVMLYYEKLK